jgi:ribonuclease E
MAPDLPTPVIDPKRNKPVDDKPTDDSHRRTRTRRRSGEDVPGEVAPNAVVKVRTPREPKEPSNEPQKVRGSTRLEAKK